MFSYFSAITFPPQKFFISILLAIYDSTSLNLIRWWQLGKQEISSWIRDQKTIDPFTCCLCFKLQAMAIESTLKDRMAQAFHWINLRLNACPKWPLCLVFSYAFPIIKNSTRNLNAVNTEDTKSMVCVLYALQLAERHVSEQNDTEQCKNQARSLIIMLG